jgi:RNA polymerase sigma-70 factor (ECF subfamily)
MPERELSALTSLTLLRRAQQGESDALDELFARYVPFLRRLAHGRVPRWARASAETADLVQDTLLHVFRRIDHFEPRGNGAMRAYLRQALHNRILNARRDATRRPMATALDDHLDFADDTPSPLDQFLSDEERARYVRALSELRAEDRDAIVGRIELGYSYEQLSAVLGKPSADAARMVVRRAVVRLAEAMGR